MTQIRCLLAGTRPRVLSEIVEQVIKNHLDVEMIERVAELNEVMPLARGSDFNVVVLDFGEDEIPKLCNDLLDEQPSLVIAGLVGDGKRLCILIDDPGPAKLTEMIRIAVKTKT